MSSFLDLPAELRDQIYDLVRATTERNGHRSLKRKASQPFGGQQFQMNSRLVITNKQIGREYYTGCHHEAFSDHGPAILALVQDADFRFIMRFFKSCTAAEQTILTSKAKLEVCFKALIGQHSRLPLLRSRVRRWVAFVERTGLQATYCPLRESEFRLCNKPVLDIVAGRAKAAGERGNVKGRGILLEIHKAMSYWWTG